MRIVLSHVTVVGGAVGVALKITLVAQSGDRPRVAVKALIDGRIHIAQGAEVACLFYRGIKACWLTVSVHL